MIDVTNNYAHFVDVVELPILPPVSYVVLRMSATLVSMSDSMIGAAVSA